MTDIEHLPIEISYSHGTYARAEQEAMERALQWAARDPFYEGKPVTPREMALMRLALRALTHPTHTDIALLGLPDDPADAG